MTDIVREPITDDFLGVSSTERAEDLRDLFIAQMEAPFRGGEQRYSEREPRAIGAFLTVTQILKVLERPEYEVARHNLKEVLTTSRRLKVCMAKWAESITDAIAVKEPYVLQALAEYMEPFRIDDYPTTEIALRKQIVGELIEEFDGTIPGSKRILATMPNGRVSYAVIKPAYTIDDLLDDAKILAAKK